nr:hypothetical protein HK105_000144 [Polyrhizophydium stewartii]
MHHSIMRDNALAQFGNRSLFDMPAVELIPQVVAADFRPHSPESRDFLANYRNRVQLKVKSYYLSVSKSKKSAQESTLALLSRFDDMFDPRLALDIISVKSSHLTPFSAEEDMLMYLGFHSFGFNDVPSIRAHFLPARTHNQIKYRYKNVINRGIIGFVRELYLQPFRMLLLPEKQLIVAGARKFGPSFKFATTILFPRCPNTLLQIAWDDLFRIAAIETRAAAHQPPLDLPNMLATMLADSSGDPTQNTARVRRFL